MLYISHVVTGVWFNEMGICDSCVCVLFVYGTSGIVFNPSTNAITDYIISVKDIYPYFKSH